MGDAGLRKSGIDDELIKSGANVLLTFTSIRNEAGKGNDVFNQASSAALDLSVALGKDLKGANILVGKALNDPIKGLTALGRVGVKFTDTEKDQIKALVDSGKTMEAQKIILGQLEEKFGGSAKAAGDTLAGQLSKAKEEFINLAGSIVGALLPAFNTFVGVLQTVAGWMSRHETATKVIIGVLAGLAVGVWAVNAAVKAWTAVQLVLNAVMAANPFVLVALAIAGLVAAFIVAYQKSETFRDIVNGVFDAVKGVATTFVDFFTKTVPGAFQTVKDWASRNWPAIATIISGPFAPLVALATDAFGIRSALLGAFGALKGEAASRTGAIVTAISDTFGRLVTVFQDQIITPLTNLVGTALGIGSDIAHAIRDGIRDGLIDVKDSIVGAMKDFLNGILRIVNKIPFLPKIAYLAEGAILRGPTAAIVGEDGPEAVIPLGRKRRKRGLDLLTRAAQIMGASGDLPGPYVSNRSGFTMLADGGIIVPGQASGLDSLMVGMLRADNTGGLFEKIADWAATGLAGIVGSLPTPSFGNPVLDGIGQGVRGAAADYLRSAFDSAQKWNVGKILDSRKWSEARVGSPYLWGGGHGGWDFARRLFDCSGGASHAAKIAGSSLPAPGTTSATLAQAQVGATGPFMWGWRGMGGSDREQHMGWKVLSQWYQYGSPMRRGGGDGQWDTLGVPPGIPTYGLGGTVNGDGTIYAHRGEEVLAPREAAAYRAGADGPLVVIENMNNYGDMDGALAAENLGNRVRNKLLSV